MIKMQHRAYAPNASQDQLISVHDPLMTLPPVAGNHGNTLCYCNKHN